MGYETMTGPELALEYNRLAPSLGLRPVKKFKDRATGVARLREVAALSTRKNSRIKFGSNIVIQLATDVNPRRSGTRAYVVFEKLMAHLEKSGGKASLSEIIASTGYRRPDYDWDLERGHIRKV